MRPSAPDRIDRTQEEVRLGSILAQEGGRIEAVFRSFESGALWVILGVSILALGVAWYFSREVLAAPEGTEKMREIARAIQVGSRAYLNRQFRTVGIFLAMFMRVGGGIFTKAADVGADLVGKVEKGIPEDDPRNAATIADNVGDNVGDCAGMAADLFESYEVTLVASLILGAAAFAGSAKGAIVGVMFPLFVRAIGVVTSVIGIVAVSPRSENEHGMRAINRGFFVSTIASVIGVFFLAQFYVEDLRVFWAVVLGLGLATVIQVLTEHF